MIYLGELCLRNDIFRQLCKAEITNFCMLIDLNHSEILVITEASSFDRKKQLEKRQNTTKLKENMAYSFDVFKYKVDLLFAFVGFF